MSATTTVVGLVTKAAIKEANGKRFASVVVKTTENRNGKDYGKKFEVTVWGKAADEAAAVKPGSLVVVTGSAGARCFEHQGKWYAQSTVSAFGVNVLMDGQAESHPELPEPRQKPVQHAAPSAAAPAPATDSADDDVPF